VQAGYTGKKKQNRFQVKTKAFHPVNPVHPVNFARGGFIAFCFAQLL
jgi:hypothetical protein